MTFLEYFSQGLARGYVIVPYHNPPAEFVAIHVLWMVGTMLLATCVAFFCLWQAAKSRRAKKT